MDIYCPKCGEPIELDCLHDEVDQKVSEGKFDYTFQNALHAFQTKGCESLTVYGNGEPCIPASGTTSANARAHAMSAMFDLLGDDVDGAAAMMEDAEMWGMFD